MSKGLTLFGIRCRAYRSRADLVMADQAKELRCSVAYISAIERGDRSIPPDYPDKFSDWLCLSDEERQYLRNIANSKKTKIEFVPSDAERAALATELSDKLNTLSADQLRQLRTFLSNKSIPPRHSDEDLKRWAQLVRTCFEVTNKLTFDLVRILENKLAQLDPSYSLLVEPDRALGDRIAGYAELVGNAIQHIVLSEHAYGAGNRQTPEGRFVQAHELAHWLLHPTVSGDETRTFKRSGRMLQYSKIEREADLFAYEFLMPEVIISRYSTPEQVAFYCNVPVKHARIWMRHLQKSHPVGEQLRVSNKFSDLLNKLIGNEQSTNVRSETGKIIPFPGAPPPNPSDNLNHRREKPRSRKITNKSQNRGLPLFDHITSRQSQTKVEAPQFNDHRQMLNALAIYSGHSQNTRLDFQKQMYVDLSTPTHSSVVNRNANWFKLYGWRG